MPMGIGAFMEHEVDNLREGGAESLRGQHAVA